jgi:uncharacterized membrane protein YebE (DUF533 family)
MKSTLMKKALGTLALSALALAASGAQADWGRGDRGYSDNGGHAYQQSRMFGQQVNARQDRQMERIQAGMRSGALTQGEFRDLMREQHKIRAMEQHFRADGLIDAREFRRLQHALDIASHNIRDEKHDRQARSAYGHQHWYN